MGCVHSQSKEELSCYQPVDKPIEKTSTTQISLASRHSVKSSSDAPDAPSQNGDVSHVSRDVSYVSRETLDRDDHNESFNAKEKRILRETWQVLAKDKQKYGVEVFVRIFERMPVAKQLFPFRDLCGEDLQNNPLFRSHAMRFMHAIEGTVVSLDALDLSLVPVLHRLGEKHVHMKGFKHEYFSVFMTSILDVVASALGPVRYTQHVRDAWATLGNFIAAKMNEGYAKGSEAKDLANSLNNTGNKTVNNTHNYTPNGTTIEDDTVNTDHIIITDKTEKEQDVEKQHLTQAQNGN